MVFHILMNQITTLFVSLGLLTTLTFDSEITSYMYGGSKEDLFLEVTNNMKTLAIKPKREGVSSNLLVITKGQKYYFDIRYDENDPHKFIEIKNGVVNNGMRKIQSSKSYDILEGGSSVMILNKENHPLVINEKRIDKKEYFSKGVPLILGNTRILN